MSIWAINAAFWTSEIAYVGVASIFAAGSDVTKTVCACFAVGLLRQLRSVRRSVPRSVLQSLLTSLVLTRLDFGNANLAGIPLYLLKRLQSVMNSTARLVFSLSRYDHITPLLRQLHWLKARERIDFKLALIIYTCQQGAAPSYLADELSQPADFEARCRLHSASSSSLIVRRARLSTIGDRAFPVAAARVCNSLPQHVTPASSLSVFRSRLKTPLLPLIAPTILLCLRITTVIVGHINRSSYLLSHNCSFIFRYVVLKKIGFGRGFSPLPRKCFEYFSLKMAYSSEF